MMFPETLLEFQEQFPDEGACWKALRRVRWPKGFVCPRCSHRKSYSLSERRLEQCQRCRYQASVTAGTVFHKTRVSLRIWFLGIFFLSRHKGSISALQFQRDTGLGSYQTAWTLLHKLRSTLGPRPDQRLQGWIEADESYVGAKRERGKPGRSRGRKAIVGVAVEQRRHTAGSARMAVLEGVSFQADLWPFLKDAIDAPHAAIRTDGLNSYRPLAEVGVFHERNVQGPDRARSTQLLPRSHTIFSNLKAWFLGTFHGVTRKHMPRYLDEFVYRFNRRWRETELFGFVLKRAVRGAPFPYSRLTAELPG